MTFFVEKIQHEMASQGTSGIDGIVKAVENLKPGLIIDWREIQPAGEPKNVLFVFDGQHEEVVASPNFSGGKASWFIHGISDAVIALRPEIGSAGIYAEIVDRTAYEAAPNAHHEKWADKNWQPTL